ncbi:unnamed protein product [Heligmosomoides polygyrus]|uniref:Reverse transcriptase domain-containing protein n=1 Tax=Heligmosomoides polygyrus TaxID=6339 RepID=A0A183GU37_HELPZ|nr:unnamed protein product [Heligmosomoides polygyrus]
MRELEWEHMGVKVDGRQLHHLRFADDIVLITPREVKVDGRQLHHLRFADDIVLITPSISTRRSEYWPDFGQLHHLRFADDIVLITPSISQAERMLAVFDRVCGNVGLQLNLTKTMFMRNGQHVYLGREVNMANDQPELSRRKRAAWGAFKSVEEVVKKTKFPKTRAIQMQDEHVISVGRRGIEKSMLGVTRLTQVREGLRSPELRRRWRIRDSVAWAMSSKIRWAGHVMRFADTRCTTAITD